MDKTPTELTVARLRELLDYAPDTGIFTWRPRPIRWDVNHGIADRAFNTVHAGKRAGCHADSARYPAIAITYGVGQKILKTVHILAWAHYYGEWPPRDIDHINRDPRDNRIANLRLVTQAQNSANRSTYRRNNTSGYIGVGWCEREQLWRARLITDGKEIGLGYFANKADAIAARRRAVLEMFGEYANVA